MKPSANQIHDRQITDWISNRFEPGDSLGTLVAKLPGVFPSVVQTTAHSLGLALEPMASEPLVRSVGPVPHPVDGDWRFDGQTIEGLLARVEQNRVGLLGCPSLVLPAARSGLSPVLIDTNTAWRDHILDHDVVDPSAVLAGAFASWADTVIADPPWYPEYFTFFLAIASRMIRADGRMFLVWPAAGTRPGVGEEINHLRKQATLAGFDLVTSHEGVVRYATPWFEAQALRAGGLPVLAGWRRSDLLELVRSGRAPPEASAPPPRLWVPRRWGNLEIRIRPVASSPPPADIRLTPLTQGAVSTSVSRRDPIRKRVNFWTAGNRVFDCGDAAFMSKVLQGREAPEHKASRALQEARTSQEATRLRAVMARLDELDEVERAEYDALHEPTSASTL